MMFMKGHHRHDASWSQSLWSVYSKANTGCCICMASSTVRWPKMVGQRTRSEHCSSNSNTPSNANPDAHVDDERK